MIAIARRHFKPVLIDPKGGDFSRYQGATLITRTSMSSVPWQATGRARGNSPSAQCNCAADSRSKRYW